MELLVRIGFGTYFALFLFLILALDINYYVTSESLAENTTQRAVTKSKTQDNFFFDPAPTSQNVVEGQEVLLRCDVSNRKHIIFYWTIDGREVQNTSRRFQIGSDLNIRRVSRDDDGGSFRCIATNVTTGVSLSSLEARLNIYWLNDVAEVFLRQPRQQSEIQDGGTFTLKCEVSGNPEPEIEWYRNRIRLFGGERVRMRSGRLRVTNVTAADNGVYACEARNRAGVTESNGNFLMTTRGPGTAHLNVDHFTMKRLVNRGSDAQFDCLFENSLLTEWYYRDIRLTNSSSQRVIYPNGTMIVRNVDNLDVGTYHCTGLSTDGPVQTYAAELILAYLDEFNSRSFEPPMIRDVPEVVAVRDNVNIRCYPPEGTPTPTVRWKDADGLDLPSAGRVYTVDGVLSISDAVQSDSGKYRCIARNIAGSRNSTAWIVVSIPPTMDRPPLSTRKKEGGTARFECLVSGTPYPVTKITWEKEGDSVEARNHPRFVSDPAAGTLTIKDVRLADEGNYLCVVNTTAHPIVRSTNAHLYVEKRLKFRPKPVNTKLELGSDARVHCNAEGHEAPRVWWQRRTEPGEGGLNDRDHNRLRPTDFIGSNPAMLSDDGHITDDEGVLTFQGVNHQDVGYYTCVASSAEGTINATIYVDVVVKPRFKVRPLNTTAIEGYPVLLHCVAVGEPTPTIQWDRNNKVNSFEDVRFRVLPNNSLSISEVYMEDIGKYGCTAGNSGGFEREEIYLNVASSEDYSRLNLDLKKRRERERQEENFSMMKTVVIAVCSAVAYLAVVIGLTIYCSIRLVKAKNLRKAREAEAAPPLIGKVENGHAHMPNENTELMDKSGKDRDSSMLKSEGDARSHASGVSSNHVGSGSSNHSHPSSGNPRSHKSYDKLSFPRHDLQTLGMLGKGHYGDVFLARAHGIRDGEVETLVAVKSLLSPEESHQIEYRREIDLFARVNHENIIKLLGVCREMEPQFIITEYLDWGDLKQFLYATRRDNPKRNMHLPPLTQGQKLTMVNQMALAMEHLTNQRLVHRDLAARNILLTPTLDLKITRLSLCHGMYAAEYFWYGRDLVPLRWMPSEALFQMEYSHKSDVFSFGVTAWEIFTLCEMPYKLHPDEEIVKSLRAGELRLDDVPGCPDQLMALIYRCCSETPAERPSFSDIVIALSDISADSDV